MPAFYNNTAIRTVIDKVLVIPYMPAEDIQMTFKSIRLESDAELASLFDYIASTWITSYQWRPSTWSVFRVEIRTNNDAEGQHTLWNKGKGKQSFYALTEYLFSFAEKLEIQAKLLAHGLLERDQRKPAMEKNKLLFRVWNDFVSHVISSEEMFKELVKILKPVYYARDEDLEDDLLYDRFLTDM